MTDMKKITLALLFISAITVTSCHYGQEEAAKTLERNELYKGDKSEYSVNRAGKGGENMNEDGAHGEASAGTVPADSAAAKQ
jgi:hypothetical protein